MVHSPCQCLVPFCLLISAVTDQILYLQLHTCYTVTCAHINLMWTLSNVLSREEQLPDSCICIQADCSKILSMWLVRSVKEYLFSHIFSEGFSGGSAVKNLRAIKKMWEMSFDPWIRKIPWRRKCQPAPVFLPGESHGQRSLGSQRVRHDYLTNFHFLSVFNKPYRLPYLL